jgi:hypothetical protein
MQAAPSYAPPVRGGPRAYRTRVRVFGPIVGMIPPAVLGAAALLTLHGSASTTRGVAGFGLAVFAAPGLLAAGVPLTTGGNRYAIAVAASAVLWFVIGMIASRRATRTPVATWRDFWREWAWPSVGVWIGVLAALGIADLAVGSALL